MTDFDKQLERFYEIYISTMTENDLLNSLPSVNHEAHDDFFLSSMTEDQMLNLPSVGDILPWDIDLNTSNFQEIKMIQLCYFDGNKKFEPSEKVDYIVIDDDDQYSQTSMVEKEFPLCSYGGWPVYQEDIDTLFGCRKLNSNVIVGFMKSFENTHNVFVFKGYEIPTAIFNSEIYFGLRCEVIILKIKFSKGF